MRRAVIGGAVLWSCLVAGCTSSPAPAPEAPTSEATAAAPSSAAPTSSPSAPTKAEDAATLRKALVKPADLGKPWTQPKTVSKVKGKKGEACPGHASTTEQIPVTASVSANLTEGRGAGRNIATYSLSALKEDSGTGVTEAYEKDLRACARYRDGSGLFVVRSAGGPTSVTGAELVTSFAERIYYDKAHRKLAYARHTLVARQGRVVTFFSYAFLTTEDDPRAKDFRAASKLLEVQLTKVADVFA